jgi:hypothetical protein
VESVGGDGPAAEALAPPNAMKLYVGITDVDWFSYLRQQKCRRDEFLATSGNNPMMKVYRVAG